MSKLSTAYHEAGHAITACELSRTYGADIIPLPGQDGVCKYKAPANEIHHLAISVAGPLAEWFFNNCVGPVFNGTSHSDLKTIDGSLLKLHGSSVPREKCREFKLAMQLARHILTYRWGAVRHVAERLVSHQKVSGYLAHAILVAAKTPPSE
jgi:hypothetical protein